MESRRNAKPVASPQLKVFLIFSILIFFSFSSPLFPTDKILHNGVRFNVDQVSDGNTDRELSPGIENGIPMNSFGRIIRFQKQYCLDLFRLIDIPPPLVTVSITDILEHSLEANVSVHDGGQIFHHGDLKYEINYSYLSNTSNTMTLQRLDNIGSRRGSDSYTLYALKSSEHRNDIVSGSLESSRQWEMDDIQKLII